MLVVNDWQIFAHPAFLDQVEHLIAVVARARDKDPIGYRGTADAKVLAAIRKLMMETIPADPTHPDFRQGSTLGATRKHWFRAKFGGQRFRLFFRFHAARRTIVLAWVNDAETRRTYGAKTDAYAVFRKMLDAGDPPDDWDALMQRAGDAVAVARLDGITDADV